MSYTLADPLGPTACRGRSDPARPRWQVWRSPDDQPPWARPALLAIAAVAAALYAWNITRAGLAPFYSVAVKSMSVSWKAFIFGAFDPKATITIDKLAGSFLPQALSARIFGFSDWSLALPQVIEGTIAVLVTYRVVRRWAGVAAGLLAAAIFTLTPIAASMFGHSMEDGALTLCLVLAADCYQRAVTEARLRSLIFAGVWVGLGFQAKMLEAWVVLPAFAVGYLVAAPAGLGRRLWQLCVAGLVMLAVSMSWIALYTLTPAADRPYVDGSTDNSAVAMVFGYNGLERFGITVAGAVTSGPGVTTSGAGTGRFGPGGFGPGAGEPPGLPGSGGGSGAQSGAGNFAGFSPGGGPSPGETSSGGFGTGWTKLLGSEYGPEIGWLYPLAVLSVAFGLIWTRGGKRTDRGRGGFIMWGLWLLTVALVYSKMSTLPHTAYLAALAPPLAALSAAGIVMFWRAYRAGGRRGWLLPVAVAAELAWALFLWRDYGGFLPWARDIAVAAGLAAVVAVVAARLSGRVPARLVTAGLVAGVAAVLAAPGAWAASVLDGKYGGSSFNASAGPAGGMVGGPGGGLPGGALASIERLFGDRGVPGGFGLGDLPAGEFPGGNGSGGGLGALSASATLTPAQQRIYDYVSAHRVGADYLMAVGSWSDAAPYVLATGQEVLPMGGFSGSVPEPTLATVQELVRSGQLRYILISGTGASLGAGLAAGAGSVATAIDSWAERACATVPARDYGGASGGFGSAGQTLRDCRGHA